MDGPTLTTLVHFMDMMPTKPADLLFMAQNMVRKSAKEVGLPVCLTILTHEGRCVFPILAAEDGPEAELQEAAKLPREKLSFRDLFDILTVFMSQKYQLGRDRLKVEAVPRRRSLIS